MTAIGENGAMGDAPSISGDRLGVIIGHSLVREGDPLAIDANRVDVHTPFGTVGLLDAGELVILRRHGIDTFTPAHRIDHRAAITALCTIGCNRVLALASTGGLRDWPVGTVVAPFDFIALAATPSFFDDARGHSIPGFDAAWRDAVIDVWRQATDTPIIDGGVYAQTAGPRFETPAEVRMLAQHADIVGMTIAGECVLAREAGLAYAVIATVDNLANGVAGTALTVDDFHAGVAANQVRLADDLRAVLPRLAATARP